MFDTPEPHRSVRSDIGLFGLFVSVSLSLTRLWIFVAASAGVLFILKMVSVNLFSSVLCTAQTNIFYAFNRIF